MSFINLQKYSQAASLILLIILISSFFFWPEKSGPIAIAVLILGSSASLALIIQHNRDTNVRSNHPRTVVTRKIALDTIGLLLVIFAAGFAGQLLGAWAGNAVEQSQPGFGMPVGLIVGIVSAFLIAWGMRIMWIKAARSLARG